MRWKAFGRSSTSEGWNGRPEMKTIVTVVCMMLCLACISHAQAVGDVEQTPKVAIYPATVDSMMKLWAQMFEICSVVGVPCHEVHVQDQDASTVVLKMESKWYVPFIKACETGLQVKPLVRLDQQGGKTSSLGVFDVEMSWPDGIPSSLDGELKALRDGGIRIERRKMTIYLVPVGKIDLQQVLEYMTKSEMTDVTQGQAGPVNQTQPPAGKPAVIPGAVPAPAPTPQGGGK